MSSCHQQHNDSGCDHSHDDNEKEGASKGDSLYQYIDTTKLWGLNLADNAQITIPFKPYSERQQHDQYLESNADDPELILFIPFTEAVSVKSICISGNRDGCHPKNVKLFANRDDIDFSNAEELPALQELELAEDFNAEIEYPLSLRKFQGISSLTLFFGDNFGGDNSQIFYIGLKGESKKWKHGVVDCVYESQAQHSDHKVTEASSHSSLI